ncbi:hypothetical protein [Streptomyces shenzhenensis]|uniref:hypothetical protein n=1 Tax=Streptomyces shenzhenensis TaxID=943815 RepID=UPI003F540958
MARAHPSPFVGAELTGGRLRARAGPARWAARVPGSEAAPGRPAAPAAHRRTAGLDADLYRHLDLRRRQPAEYEEIERRDVPPAGAGPQDRPCHLVLRAGIGLEMSGPDDSPTPWRRSRPCRPTACPGGGTRPRTRGRGAGPGGRTERAARRRRRPLPRAVPRRVTCRGRPGAHPARERAFRGGGASSGAAGTSPRRSPRRPRGPRRCRW